MFKKKLHLHSMMVHVIAVLAPITAIAYLLFAFETTILHFTTSTWETLVVSSIIFMLLVSVPSIITGIFERDHIYAKWHSTHKYKLLFSIILLASLLAQAAMLVSSGLENASVSGPFGFLVVVVNNVATFFLGFYGLKISIGRQGFGKTAYEPDLFKKEPFDILTRAEQYAKEDAKYVDMFEENN